MILILQYQIPKTNAMKILNSPFRVTLALFILLANLATGQNFIENSFPVKNTTHATAIPGGWVVPMNSGDCRPNKILEISNGGIIYRQINTADSAGFPSIYIDDIVRTSSGNFICAGLADDQADVESFLYPYIFKMDSNGRILWQTMFSVGQHTNASGHSAFTRVILAPDGSIYGVTRDGFIGKTDSLGSIKWMKSFKGANDITWVSKGLIIASNRITLLDTAGNTIKKYSPILNGANLSRLINGTKGRFYAIDSNYIYTLDSDIKATDSFKFSTYATGSINNFIVNYADDSGYYFAEGNILKGFDVKGNLKWINSLPVDCNTLGLSTDGHQIAVTGSTATSAFIKTFNVIGGNTIGIPRDIRIIRLKPVNTSMHMVQPNFSAVVSKIDVTVQNENSETIDSFYLFSHGPLSSPYYFCSDEYIASFHNLNLASGDTVTLHVTIGRTWNAPQGTPYSLSIKLFTSSPNGKLDNIPSNDTASYSTTVLGINETHVENQSINIYPNPASNIIHIDNNFELNTSISLSDITGKEIMTIANPKNQFDLDVSNLPGGIYFVKVWNEDGMKVEKIVKD